ncbi:DUF502 domain-containing protein [Desulfuromonas sp. AOP6]|uniref:DUF502 domain-containing protein n=1 Tax=Desulfuromonas sp. AOP6 TaxID=1566351 RepID=UPI0012755547|nr:DUF502 domain-containing protein [Desulfuromonas sp. AOP6]BCA78429.1 membrane protein [Desulfuromonas sp. AOP6]
MKRLGRIMFQGLAAILPAALTIYILFWSATTAEKLLGGVIQMIVPERFYVPGMGLLAGVFVIFLLGLALNAFLVRRLFDFSESLMNRIPLVKTLYGSVKDFVGFFSHQKNREFNQVVTLELNLGGMPMRFLGFVTRTDFHDLPKGIGQEGEVAVYLPLSYQIGGYTVMVPRSAVKPVDISMQRAMGFAVTAGMFTEKGRPAPPQKPLSSL